MLHHCVVLTQTQRSMGGSNKALQGQITFLVEPSNYYTPSKHFSFEINSVQHMWPYKILTVF